MSRLENLNPEQTTGKSAELLQAVRDKMGMVPNITRVMANSPAALESYLAQSGALDGSSLSKREKEQIALSVAEDNDCDYCRAAHSAVGKMVGLSELEIRDARLGTGTSTRENAILTLSREVLRERGAVSDATLARVREAGLTDGEIAEVVAVVSLNVYTNYINRLAQTKVDFPAAAPLEARTA